MTDHANELRRHARKIPHPQGETPGVMLRAANEIERLQSVITSPHNMTRDDVIRMAREADPGFEGGEESDGTMTDSIVGIDQVFKFAALVAAAEREACAKAIENSMDQLPDTSDWANGYIQATKDIAEGIRARGNQ